MRMAADKVGTYWTTLNQNECKGSVAESAALRVN